MSEAEIFQIIVENLGGFGVGIFGTLLLFLRNKSLRRFQIYHLFEKHMWNSDPEGQYSVLEQQLKYWESSKGHILAFDDKGRQAIFQDLIHIKVQVFREYSQKFYKKYKKLKDGQEMYNLILEMFSEITKEINTRQASRGIPEVQIEKYQLWQRPSYQFTLSQMKSISFSKVYRSVDCKVEAIFSLLGTNMELSLIEAERTLHSLNGSLTGKAYKGFVCGPLEGETKNMFLGDLGKKFF